jgi:hypothetical protein
MRVKHFIAEQQLDELAMNPTSLRSVAAKIDARVGMEFEMYVPDTNGGAGDSDYDDWQPDYEADDYVSDFADIIAFFDNGEFAGSSGRALALFREKMEGQFYDWVEEQIHDSWRKEGRDAIRDYMVNNDLWDEDEAITLAFEEMDLTDDEKNRAEKVGAQLNARKYNRVKGEVSYRGDDEKNWDEAAKRAEDAFEERVGEEWQNEGRISEDAFEEYQSEERENFSEQDFLRDKGVRTALNAFEEFEPRDVYWPHMVNHGGGGNGSQDADDVARDFEAMIGRPVMSSDQYHGVKRNGVSYVVEPDGSLDEANSGEDAGLEFVSPPLPLNDMLSDLKKVKAWCDDKGCYTNESTGLHINVSIPGMGEEGKLDYVKLALLMGDKHVLEQFGRAGNTYAKSAMDMIKTAVRTRPESAAAMLDKMKGGLDKLASKIIHTGKTEKFTSINTKEGYVEFRSPGDDWLGKYYNQIEPTVLRLVVALDAACDPEKSRQEYLKKLYTVLTPSSSADPLAYFAQYAAGDLTKSALRMLVKQVQTARELKRNPPPAAPVAPVENLEGKPWARWRINATAGRTIPVSARSHAEAIQRCGIPEAQIVSVVIDDGNLTPPQPARREEPDFGEDVPWEIYDRASGERRFVSFMSQANNAQLAASNAVAMLNNINTPQDERRGLGVRMLGGV